MENGKSTETVSMWEVVGRLSKTPKEELELNMKAYNECLMKLVEDFEERLSQIRTTFKDYFNFTETGVTATLAVDGKIVAVIVSGPKKSIDICLKETQRAVEECDNA